MQVYGLKNCDTCRKAMKELTAKGWEANLVDVRKTPPSAADLERWYGLFGEDLINRRSTTWRKMSVAERSADPVTMLKENPTLMKRPVIKSGDRVHFGWTDRTRAMLLA